MSMSDASEIKRYLIRLLRYMRSSSLEETQVNPDPGISTLPIVFNLAKLTIFTFRHDLLVLQLGKYQ